MSPAFLYSYHIDITPLSPLHLGTGETYDPTGYVIDSGTLSAFSAEDALAVCTADDRKRLLVLVSMRDPVAVLRGVQTFFFERRERLVARSSHFAPVRPANERFYLDRVGAETNPGVTNLLDIERTAYDLATGRPYLPGSGIKGAIRTALLDSINAGRPASREENNAALQQRLFGFRAGKFELDPMRLVQIGDAALRGEDDLPATEIRFALNRKKRRVLRDGNPVLSQAEQRNLYQVLETIRPLTLRAFRARLNIQRVGGLGAERQGDKLPRAGLRWGMEGIARTCHRFYLDRFEREMAILKERGFVDNKWADTVAGLLGSDLRKKQVEQGQAFLLRIGRHSGAESVTLNGVGRIKILEGYDPVTRRMRSSEQSEAKTLWLAGDDPNASENLLPFGWVLVEVSPEGTELPQWEESFDEYQKPAREWRKRLDARLSELRMQQAKSAARQASSDIPGSSRRASAIAEQTFADPFFTRLRAFKSKEFSQLRQVVQQIESRPDRDECLRLLGSRLRDIYATDKKRLKRLRADYPALAPYLVKP